MNKELINKIQAFRKKYYTNKLLRGLIYIIGLGALLWLAISGVEAVGNLSKNYRLILFMLGIAGYLILILNFIIVPLSYLLKISKGLNLEESSKLIGRHFPEIDDKLLNTIQLSQNSEHNELAKAALDQRTLELKVFEFRAAVDFKANLKHWPLIALPALVILLIFSFDKGDDLIRASKRISAYQEEFIPKAPFSFFLENEDLIIEIGEEINIELELRGNKLPSSVQIVLNEQIVDMSSDATGSFDYLFKNLQKDQTFYFSAGPYKSTEYKIRVLRTPIIDRMEAVVSPPSYTGISAYKALNTRSFEAPEGSQIHWQLEARETDVLKFNTNLDTLEFVNTKAGYQLKQYVSKSFDYSLDLLNSDILKRSMTIGRVNVQKDLRPRVKAEFERESNLLFFKAEASDDYGLSKWDLIIKVNEKEILIRSTMASDLGISGLMDLDSLKIEQATLAEVFIRVFDNDGVNGSKSTDSKSYNIELKTIDERRSDLKESYAQSSESRKSLIKDMEETSKSLDELSKEIKTKGDLSWEDKEALKELLEKKKDLAKKAADLKKLEEEIKKEEEFLNGEKEELKEKEKDVEELNEKSKEEEELQKLMEEIEEYLDKLDTKKLLEKMDELKQNSLEEVRKEKRMESLLEDLKLQRDALKLSDDLEKLAEKQEELSKEEGLNDKEAADKQEEINKEFSELEKKSEELREKNSKLDEKLEKENFDESKENAKYELEKAGDKSKSKQEKSKSQKSAAEEMSEMSKKMFSSIMGMSSDQQKENMENLQQILENLESLSFGIEGVADKAKVLNGNTPAVKPLLIKQKELELGSKVIKDSLIALSQRAPQIEEKVFEELRTIETSFKNGQAEMEEMRSAKAAEYQQGAMTSANELALILDAALRQMQQQMAQAMKGDQSCEKPGQGKPSMSNMRKLQSELAKEMGEQMKGNKPGQNEGEKGQMGEGGTEGAQGSGGNSKELAKMLAKQEALRRALEKESEGIDGSGDLKKAIEEMKELERDIINNNLSQESLNRVKRIESRLLNSAKAELEREKDEKRESKGSDLEQLYQEALEEYLNKKKVDREVLRRSSYRLNEFYKKQSAEYLNRLDDSD